MNKAKRLPVPVFWHFGLLDSTWGLDHFSLCWFSCPCSDMKAWRKVSCLTQIALTGGWGFSSMWCTAEERKAAKPNLRRAQHPWFPQAHTSTSWVLRPLRGQKLTPAEGKVSKCFFLAFREKKILKAGENMPKINMTNKLIAQWPKCLTWARTEFKWKPLPDWDFILHSGPLKRWSFI